jgi:ribonuclease P protein component
VPAGVGAPSRTFRKAVQRNRVKRLLREAYRLEKPNFMSQASLEHKRVNLFFLYTDAVVLTQAVIQEKVKEALALLIIKLNKS